MATDTCKLPRKECKRRRCDSRSGPPEFLRAHATWCSFAKSKLITLRENILADSDGRARLRKVEHQRLEEVANVETHFGEKTS